MLQVAGWWPIPLFNENDFLLWVMKVLWRHECYHWGGTGMMTFVVDCKQRQCFSSCYDEMSVIMGGVAQGWWRPLLIPNKNIMFFVLWWNERCRGWGEVAPGWWHSLLIANKGNVLCVMMKWVWQYQWRFTSDPHNCSKGLPARVSLSSVHVAKHQALGEHDRWGVWMSKIPRRWRFLSCFSLRQLKHGGIAIARTSFSFQPPDN